MDVCKQHEQPMNVPWKDKEKQESWFSWNPFATQPAPQSDSPAIPEAPEKDEHHGFYDPLDPYFMNHHMQKKASTMDSDDGYGVHNGKAMEDKWMKSHPHWATNHPCFPGCDDEPE